VSFALSTSGPDPNGTHSTYGSVESGSGFRAIRNVTGTPDGEDIGTPA
jgi:hypothetical protein